MIKTLCEDDENAWATYNRGQPLTPRQLARLLKGYNIASKDLRFSGRIGIKGFELGQFTDTFTRYLTTPSENTSLSATPLQTNSQMIDPVAGNNNVADSTNNVANTQKLHATSELTSDKTCSAVAAKEPITEVAEKPSKISHLRF